MRLAAIGDNCVDIYRELGQVSVGGQAANVAANWARMGVASEYFGLVGLDPAGLRVLDALRAAGVGIEHVRRVPGNTGHTDISIRDGERVFGYSEPGVCRNYEPSADDIEGLDPRTSWVHLANLGAQQRTVRALTSRWPEMRVSWDLSDDFARSAEPPNLSGVEVAFFSWDGKSDGDALNAAKRLTAAGARLAVGTCGRLGSIAWDGTTAVSEPALSVAVVDTCGAGDAYIASLIVQRLAGEPLQSCMRIATREAAEACTYTGSFPQVAWPLEGALRDV
jgi:fructoselysine 6-kinase